MMDLSFYKGKKVLITGHTGFKGTWMCKMLLNAGAIITGYALVPPTQPSLFSICGLEDGTGASANLYSVIGDIRDLAHLQAVFRESQPEIVIHMAAQPLVRESYQNPVYTYEVNVMGTVHVLECIRNTNSVKSFLNVTTDKVYYNREWCWGYRENEELNGFDPYSNSKSCSELVTSSYKNSFFMQETDHQVAISTARAGNVIGGGDFAADRIIPDCIRAVKAGQPIIVRNPYSTRPYQHVLEPIAVYLMIAQAQYEESTAADNYNVGPNDADCLTTGNLVTLFCEAWNQVTGDYVQWKNEYDGGPHEANFLKLDCSKLKNKFGWQPRWNVTEAMDKIVEWSKVYMDGQDAGECMDKQIREFLQ